MARIAVGGFQHETNTFAPQRATWADFERADAWPPFVRGAELIDAVQGYNIPIACNRATADFVLSSPLMEQAYAPSFTPEESVADLLAGTARDDP